MEKTIHSIYFKIVLDHGVQNVISHDPQSIKYIGEFKVDFQIISHTCLAHLYPFEWVPNGILCHSSKGRI